MIDQFEGVYEQFLIYVHISSTVVFGTFLLSITAIVECFYGLNVSN